MEDADGKCTEIGTKVLVTGVVNSINWRPTGLDFLISDENNNGVFVFNNSDNLGYTVTEGDEVTVKGSVTQFNGKVQIEALEVTVNSTGNPTLDATVVSDLNEDTEGKIVQVSGFNYVDIEQWKGTGSYNVEITDGNVTLEMRIDEDTNLDGAAAPVAPFNVTGAGGQYDTDSPYLEGYQLLVRYASDIQSVSAIKDLSELGEISISPNPASNFININTNIKNIDKIEIYNLIGTRVLEANFNDRLDLTNFNNGIYIIKLVKNDYIYAEKIIKI
jgi:hypothetical protein